MILTNNIPAVQTETVGLITKATGENGRTFLPSGIRRQRRNNNQHQTSLHLPKRRLQQHNPMSRLFRFTLSQKGKLQGLQAEYLRQCLRCSNITLPKQE